MKGQIRWANARKVQRMVPSKHSKTNALKWPKMLQSDHSPQEQSVWNDSKQPFTAGVKCAECLLWSKNALKQPFTLGVICVECFEATIHCGSKVCRMLWSKHSLWECSASNGWFKAFIKQCFEASKNASKQPFNVRVECVECFEAIIHCGSEVQCTSKQQKMLQSNHLPWDWSAWNASKQPFSVWAKCAG